MSLSYNRSSDVKYTQIYSQFAGKKEFNGQKRSFWVQDLTEEYIDEVIEKYISGFLVDELLCKTIDIRGEPQSIEDFRSLWKMHLPKKTSVICLCKCDNGIVKIAGFNCLYVIKKSDAVKELKGVRTKKVIDIMEYLMTKKNQFEEFNTDAYLSALGLYVLPEFRGEGIGRALLEAREPLCKNIGIRLTMTVFTSIAAMKQAYKAGFKDYVVEKYRDIPEYLQIPNIEKECDFVVFTYNYY